MSKILELADDYAEVYSDSYYKAIKKERRAALQAEVEKLEAEIDRLRVPMNRRIIQSIKQEAETALVIGDEIGMRDGLTQILKECDAALEATK